MAHWLGIVLEFGKLRVSLLVTITAACGYLIAVGRFDLGLTLATFGTLFLAFGASTLNQVQEWRYDAQMERTRLRPIPSGRATVTQGLVIAVHTLLLGSLMLGATGSLAAVIVGWVTLAWYNLVYTYLKRVTAYAIIPGSVVGALPPVIGWCAAGRSAFEPPIVALGFFLFVWQIPHFWILLMKFGKQYGEAGMPTLTSHFDNGQLGRITYTWVVATIAVGCSLPWFGIGRNLMFYGVVVLGGFWLAHGAGKLVTAPESQLHIGRAFHRINLFALFVVALAAVDRILR